MGIFGLFKKNEVEPIPPPMPEDKVKAPVEFPETDSSNDNFNDFPNDPFAQNQEAQNNSEERNFQPSFDDEVNEMPPPPKFESLDTEDKFTSNNDLQSEKPFDPGIPDLNSSSQISNQDGKEFSSELPNPFDTQTKTNENQLFGKKMPSFAERFGTTPNFNEADKPNEEKNEDEVKKIENIEENKTEIEKQDLFKENNSFDGHDDHEKFSFSNQERHSSLNQNESLINKPFSEDFINKIESKIDEHVDEINNKDSFEEVFEKSKNIQKANLNKPIKSGSSYYINAEDCNIINDNILEIKSSVKVFNDIKIKISELEKNSDTEYFNMRKNMENIQSLFSSIDKKLFR